MNFRPQRLANIIGQDQAKEALSICVKSANKLNRPLPHILFQGPAGLGKTTFAYALANEVNKSCTTINGATLKNNEPIIKALIQAKDGDIIFIDEIHAMPDRASELLYMPLEDRKLIITKTKGKSEQAITIPLNDFCLIGATTNVGLLPKPLMDRMGFKVFLEYYSDKDLVKIIQNNIRTVGLNITESAAYNLAQRCKGTPRIANNYVKWLKNYAVAHGIYEVSTKICNAACNTYGIDENGLDKNDIAYLNTLKSHDEPLGIKAIASITNIPEKSIEEHIEPHLLRLGLIRKTKRGRTLNLSKSQEEQISELMELFKESL